MSAITIIGIIIGVALSISVLTIIWEYIRYESGLFKPMYEIECVKANIIEAEENIKAHKNDANFKELIRYQDVLDFWNDQLNKIKKYNRLHGK